VDISEVLKPELMKFDMEAREKRQAILELAQLMWEHGYVEDLQGLVDATMAREAEYSTGIGMGVGIPHAKSPLVKQPVVAFGKSSKASSLTLSMGSRSTLSFSLPYLRSLIKSI